MGSTACPHRAPYSFTIDELVGDEPIQGQKVDLYCSVPVVIDSLAPGRYRLENRAGGPLTIEPADITLKEGADIELELKAREAVPITGKIFCDCKRPWMDDSRPTQVEFLTEEGGAFTNVPKDGGSFEAILPIGGMTRIDVKPLPPGMYVSKCFTTEWSAASSCR